MTLLDVITQNPSSLGTRTTVWPRNLRDTLPACFAGGVPSKVISEHLGHKTPVFSLKQYADVIPGYAGEAAMVVTDLVKRSTTEPSTW